MSSQESILTQSLEARVTKLEIRNEAMTEDLKEIKTSLRWLMGLVFSLNTTIIGIVTKGFGIF